LTTLTITKYRLLNFSRHELLKMLRYLILIRWLIIKVVALA